MAPYLLIGFALAGLLHAWLSADAVTRLLGRPGPSQVLRAVILGIPLPVCSCGVIPVGATLKQKGASNGATAGFVLTTPQTGIDSLLATYGLMGLPAALLRLVVSLVAGTAAGLVGDRFKNEPLSAESESCDACCGKHGEQTQADAANWSQKLSAGSRFAFQTLPGDVRIPVVLGVFIAATMAQFLSPETWPISDWPLPLTYLLATAISLPVYVCSTGAIPIAAAMLVAGFSPGTALVFLVGGPAANAATFGILQKTIGFKATLASLSALVVSLWGIAAIIDQLFPNLLKATHNMHGQMDHDVSFLALSSTIMMTLTLLMPWKLLKMKSDVR